MEHSLEDPPEGICVACGGTEDVIPMIQVYADESIAFRRPRPICAPCWQAEVRAAVSEAVATWTAKLDALGPAHGNWQRGAPDMARFLREKLAAAGAEPDAATAAFLARYDPQPRDV